MSTRLTDKVATQIKKHIVLGTYSPGSRLRPERELCEEFGVSRRTVRSALSALEKQGLVEKIPRQGIAVTRNATQQVNIGPVIQDHLLFIRWTNDPLFAALTTGMMKMAQECGTQPMILDARRSHDRYLNAIRYPLDGARGLMIYPFANEEYRSAVERALAAGMKVVFIDRVLDSFEVSSVTVDNFAGAYYATDHLCCRHDRPVYHFGWPDQPSSSYDRYRGWAAAMQDHGFADWKDFMVRLPETEQGLSDDPEEKAPKDTHDKALELFRLRKEKTYCIFTVNDVAARGVYTAAAAAGRKIGQDVFVVGFDDRPLCERMDPPLSSVHQPVDQVGYWGTKILYQDLMGKIMYPVNKVLPVKLMIRASSTG